MKIDIFLTSQLKKSVWCNFERLKNFECRVVYSLVNLVSGKMSFCNLPNCYSIIAIIVAIIVFYTIICLKQVSTNKKNPPPNHFMDNDLVWPLSCISPTSHLKENIEDWKESILTSNPINKIIRLRVSNFFLTTKIWALLFLKLKVYKNF